MSSTGRPQSSSVRATPADITAGSVTIDSSSVVRTILQFLKENGLTRSLHVLQEETGVSLGAVPNQGQVVKDVLAGKWDKVLEVCGISQLPVSLLSDLYEQIALEMVESGNLDTATKFLTETHVLQALKQSSAPRYKRLENFCEQRTRPSSEALYGAPGRQKRRKIIASSLSDRIQTVPPSRLTELIGTAVRTMVSLGAVPPNTKFDVFRGVVADEVTEGVFSVPATNLRCEIKFRAAGSVPTVVGFSPDGISLASGSSDGVIEIWSWFTGTLREDLDYQRTEAFMTHAEQVPITALGFSSDGVLLASGDEKGNVKIWKVSTGQCLKELPKLHYNAITSVHFQENSPKILTSSLDQTVKVTGLKSGQTLKIFRGNEGFVRSAIFMKNGSHILAGGDDGKIFVYNAKTADIIHSFSPPSYDIAKSSSGTNKFAPVLMLMPHPKDEGNIIVVNESPVIHLMAYQLRHSIRTFVSEKSDSSLSDFSSCTMSPSGDWLYGITSDGSLLVFDMCTGELASDMEQIMTGGVYGVVHHPSKNAVVCWDNKPGRILVYEGNR